MKKTTDVQQFELEEMSMTEMRTSNGGAEDNIVPLAGLIAFLARVNQVNVTFERVSFTFTLKEADSE